MTDQEINEACARKLGHYVDHELQMMIPKEERCMEKILGFNKPIPRYCHSIGAAWEIVEHKPTVYSQQYQEDFDFCLQLVDRQWQAGWHKIHWDCESEEWIGLTVAATAPRAICLAFLKLEDKS